ncbi:MAG: MerR family transcriptional regulator [Actinomycetota bacterium]|nr:MerR family transcriptional regulator [Actinomycetota bacterium]
MLSVQPAFLRRLDSEGVVSPQRSVGGQRRYTRMEIAAVQRIQQMSGEGLTLEGIRRILVLEAEVARLESALESARSTRR